MTNMSFRNAPNTTRESQRSHARFLRGQSSQASVTGELASVSSLHLRQARPLWLSLNLGWRDIEQP